MVDTLGVGFLPVACGGWAAGVVMPSGSMVRGWCLALALALAARRRWQAKPSAAWVSHLCRARPHVHFHLFARLVTRQAVQTTGTQVLLWMSGLKVISLCTSRSGQTRLMVAVGV